MKATLLKYYSVTSGSLEACTKRYGELTKKHPDREYRILKNMRGHYSEKCSLVQVEEVEIDFPTVEELDLPAPVPKPPGLFPFHNKPVSDDWAAWERDQRRRKKAISDAQEPARKLLKRPLNPK